MYKHLTARVISDPFGCHAYIWGFKPDYPSYYIERPYISYTVDQAIIALKEFYPGINILNKN